VNGSDLARGLTDSMRPGVAVTGGLAGDGANFEETCVIVDGTPGSRVAVAIGFYGARLRVGYGSLGGWDTFGPDRVIRRSKDNVLYELDGESALSLSRRYLGPHADQLPASGLLFPLALLGPNREPGVVRTILGINDEDGSLTFAGDVPQGRYTRLMQANMDRLIDGATGAATASRVELKGTDASLALLVSCVGRKLVLGVRTNEEIESVRDVLGTGCAFSGFYSYGEFSPLTPHARCDLPARATSIPSRALRPPGTSACRERRAGGRAVPGTAERIDGGRAQRSAPEAGERVAVGSFRVATLFWTMVEGQEAG
jgi:hypothetical protein